MEKGPLAANIRSLSEVMSVPGPFRRILPRKQMSAFRVIAEVATASLNRRNCHPYIAFLAVGKDLRFCLRLIASQITKLLWPLQQSALPTFSFFRRCGAIGVAVDDLASQIGCLVPGFGLAGVGGALGAPVFNGPAFIVPTLSRTLAWVMCGLWALVHHACNMAPFAAIG